MSNYQVKAINAVLTAAQRFYDTRASLPQREAALRAEFIGERLNDAVAGLKAEVSQLQKNMNVH